MSQCEACNIIVPGGAVEWKKHQKTSGHKWRTNEMVDCQKKVFVGDIPPWIEKQKIFDYFSQFAPIINMVTPTGRYAIIEYSSSNTVDKILKCAAHVVMGRKLKVCRKKYNAGPAVARAKKMSELFATLKKVSGVEEQMKQLESLTKLSASDRQKRLDMKQHLQDVLQQYIPEVRLVAYGSSISGLGMTHCDVDVMLQYDRRRHRANLPHQFYAPPLPHLGAIKRQLSVTHGRVSLDSLLRCDLQEQVMFFLSVLKCSEMAACLDRYQPIYKARVPLIRVHYKPDDFDIDLTFGPNSLAVVNTRLIQLLLSLDERVSPLLFTIKTWAKQMGVSDSATPVSLSSYALVMLVYTYLQNTSPPVLPSVSALASLCGPTDSPDVFMDIDCSFCKSVPRIHDQLLTPRNTQSLPDLLADFFKFYTQKNILDSIICPRNGSYVDVLKFRSTINCSPHLTAFKIREINIQDPFEVCHNTGGNVNLSSARHISRAFFTAASIVQQNPSSWDLTSVLTSEPVFETGEQGNNVEFCYHSPSLPGRFLICKDAAHAHRVWFDWILDLVRQILSILRVKFSDSLADKCEKTLCQNTGPSSANKTCGAASLNPSNKRQNVDDGNPDVKRIKVGDGSSSSVASSQSVVASSSTVTPSTIFDTPPPVCSSPRESVAASEKGGAETQDFSSDCVIVRGHIFRCEMSQNVWSGRKGVRKLVDQGPLKDGDLLSREEEVSRLLLDQTDQPNCAESISFTITAHMCMQGHETLARLFAEGDGVSEFSSFETFFKTYLQKTVKNILSTH